MALAAECRQQSGAAHMRAVAVFGGLVQEVRRRAGEGPGVGIWRRSPALPARGPASGPRWTPRAGDARWQPGRTPDGLREYLTGAGDGSDLAAAVAWRRLRLLLRLRRLGSVAHRDAGPRSLGWAAEARREAGGGREDRGQDACSGTGAGGPRGLGPGSGRRSPDGPAIWPPALATDGQLAVHQDTRRLRAESAAVAGPPQRSTA